MFNHKLGGKWKRQIYKLLNMCHIGGGEEDGNGTWAHNGMGLPWYHIIDNTKFLEGKKTWKDGQFGNVMICDLEGLCWWASTIVHLQPETYRPKTGGGQQWMSELPLVCVGENRGGPVSYRWIGWVWDFRIILYLKLQRWTGELRNNPVEVRDFIIILYVKLQRWTGDFEK